MQTLLYTDSDACGYSNKNISYILGFQPSLGYIFLTEESVFLIFDARYFEKVRHIPQKKILQHFDEKKQIHYLLLEDKIEIALQSISKTRKIQVEESMSIELWNRLKNF